MLLMILFGTVVAYLMSLPKEMLLSWKLPVIGLAFGLFTLITERVSMSSNRLAKIGAAILIPYTAILILLLGLRESKKIKFQKFGTILAVAVMLPVVVMIGDLLYKAPKRDSTLDHL